MIDFSVMLGIKHLSANQSRERVVLACTSAREFCPVTSTSHGTKLSHVIKCFGLAAIFAAESFSRHLRRSCMYDDHQIDEDIYEKTVKVLREIDIYAFYSGFVELQSSNVNSWSNTYTMGLCWRNGPLLSLFYTG